MGATDKGGQTGPDGNKLYLVIEGEFEYETASKETIRIKKSGAGIAKKEFDVRKLLFSRKKANIDDRRRVIVEEEKR